ncbi:zinc finger protein 883-like [Anopheles maculipalpis]|uniref:zinc finger protein 883-like n=1 Tax=Anopheles maculipalpis TaxID=1496333 RepID=UPI0021596C0E|nr:zinc finger protein 883-like [Anopheles maculipalpis]
MENMDAVCHLCLDGENNVLISLEDQELAAKVDRVFYFEITHFSQSSGIICDACKRVIEAFYEYAEKVAQNQAYLREKIHTELAKVQEHQTEDGYKNRANVVDSLAEVIINLDDSSCENRLEELIERRETNKNPSEASDDGTEDDDDSASWSKQNWLPDGDDSQDSEILPCSSKRTKLSTQSAPSVSKKAKAKKLTEKVEQNKANSNQSSTQASAERLVLEHHKLTCDLCSASLSDFNDLHKHYKLEHNVKGYLRCCNRMIHKKCWMIEHLQLHINPNTFRCEQCAKNYSSSKVLKEHMKEVHASNEQRSIPCTKCQKTFVSRSHLNAHFMVAHGTVPCPQCEKVLASQGSLRKHLVAVHGEGEKHVCEVCARIFRSKQCLDAHRKEHEGRQLEDKVQCEQCKVWLMNKYCLRKHVRRMHLQKQEEEVECETCGKMAPNREALSNHIRRTHREKPLECNWCDKKFNRPHHMREHVAIHHTGEQLYGCSHCTERFNTNNKLYLHRKTVHPEEYEEELRKRKLKEL